MKYIYADYAATTPTDKRVLKVANRLFSKVFGNPSSVHAFGIDAKKALTDARRKVADFFNCDPSEIVFTSGGTESENLAIKGAAFSNRKFGKHIIISSVEHAAIESSVCFLERQGFEATRIPVDRSCTVDVSSIEKAIRDDTTLISIMYVNNEIGSVEPIRDVSEMIARVNDSRQAVGKHKIHFHVDGEAGSIYLDYDVKALGVDSMSVNGSKVYAMKGSSALYVKNGVGIATQICGGGQESMIRGGTENVPAIVALGEALEIAKNERQKNFERVALLKSELAKALIEDVPGVRINTPINSVPNILHATFLSRQVDDFIGKLNELGICASSGSACASNKAKGKSRVLQAVGFSDAEIDMSVRFSLGKANKRSDIGVIIKAINNILNN